MAKVGNGNGWSWLRVVMVKVMVGSGEGWLGIVRDLTKGPRNVCIAFIIKYTNGK